jgi:IMP dehydrogenase
MIIDPITIIGSKDPRSLRGDEKYRISSPRHQRWKIAGILTNRDLRFEKRLEDKISSVMTKDRLITAAVGTTLEEAKEILHRNRIEKLLVVDEKNILKGLITIKDIEKIRKYPNSCKDHLGRLRVGAAVGPGKDREARVEALIRQVSIFGRRYGLGPSRTFSHPAGSKYRLSTRRERATKEDSISSRRGCHQDRVGPGSICTTRIVASRSTLRDHGDGNGEI